MQETALQDVMSIIGCSRATARALLMHFRWNCEMLFGAPLSGWLAICRPCHAMPWNLVESGLAAAVMGLRIPDLVPVQVSWLKGDKIMSFT
jgi:hypothetical protein